MEIDHANAPAMTRESMMEFAQRWIDAWNRRDVDAVLNHFADDAIFISPVAHRYVGSSILHGKATLAGYWRTALEGLPKLEFVIDHAIWDPDARVLLVLYEADLNGERRRACEVMIFDPAGRQIRGEAMYGASL